MTLTTLRGIIRFKVSGQVAIPKWQQIVIRDAMANADSPPESLRFQCRIAIDAQTAFKSVQLSNGETLTLHPKTRPQFGKNQDGNAYLTATMTYSGDGENYTFRWVGDGVPPKMQEVAVQHDKGATVKPVTIGLSLEAAQITPAQTIRPVAPRARDSRAEAVKPGARVATGGVKFSRSKRTCPRLTDTDLSMVKGDQP